MAEDRTSNEEEGKELGSFYQFARARKKANWEIMLTTSTSYIQTYIHTYKGNGDYHHLSF